MIGPFGAAVLRCSNHDDDKRDPEQCGKPKAIEHPTRQVELVRLRFISTDHVIPLGRVQKGAAARCDQMNA